MKTHHAHDVRTKFGRGLKTLTLSSFALAAMVAFAGCSDDKEAEPEKPAEAVDGAPAGDDAKAAAVDPAAEAAKDLSADNVAAEIEKLDAEIAADDGSDEGDPE